MSSSGFRNPLELRVMFKLLVFTRLGCQDNLGLRKGSFLSKGLHGKALRMRVDLDTVPSSGQLESGKANDCRRTTDRPIHEAIPYKGYFRNVHPCDHATVPKEIKEVPSGGRFEPYDNLWNKTLIK
ncbi:hypothetical protein HAX54_027464 [Datura stramonium]|uniref:Uncharacterized protein n=1 Tax=Datura stramonium TaxID=4076 RepID=A0ABS8V2T5_DATST|nr:hypothetical protein [Datura stramonium]